MNKNATVTVRIEDKLKFKAEKILGQLGLSPSNAVTMLYKQIALNKGLPFDVKLPNETTKMAIEESVNTEKLASFSSIEDLMNDLKS